MTAAAMAWGEVAPGCCMSLVFPLSRWFELFWLLPCCPKFWFLAGTSKLFGRPALLADWPSPFLGFAPAFSVPFLRFFPLSFPLPLSSVSRLALASWWVLFPSFDGCCILTSGTDLSDDPSLQLSSDMAPSSSLLLAVVLSFVLPFLSFSSFLFKAFNFRFCFPFGSLESFKSLLGADSHLFGTTTLIISSLRFSG